MPKLVLQLAVAVMSWFGLRSLEVPLLGRIVALFVGVAIVHTIWERLRPPYLVLGAFPIASDDPVMLDAIGRARATLPRFLASIFPARPKDSPGAGRSSIRRISKPSTGAGRPPVGVHELSFAVQARTH